jgi:hypothetical protein
LEKIFTIPTKPHHYTARKKFFLFQRREKEKREKRWRPVSFFAFVNWKRQRPFITAAKLKSEVHLPHLPPIYILCSLYNLGLFLK